jgi:type IV secretory pathway protease TraF
MKPTHARYMLMFLALALLAGTVQGMEDGTAIDWRKNIISSRGISSIRVNKAGKPVSLHDGQVVSINEARRAAYERSREIALEKMISLLKTIQVNQDHTLEELMERDENTQLKLGSLLDGKSGRQFPADFYSSGCELKITMGEIMECLNFSYPDRDFPPEWMCP